MQSQVQVLFPKKGQKQQKAKGFTLIELLIVLAIISILAALFVSSLLTIQKRSRDSKRKSDLHQIQAALELYRSDSAASSYPTSQSTAPFFLPLNCPPGENTSFGNQDETNFLKPCQTIYLPSVPKDPINTSFNGGNYYYKTEKDSITGEYRYYELDACLETDDPQGVKPENTTVGGLDANCNSHKYFQIKSS